MKCIYIADDGTQFNDHDECEEYERHKEYHEQIKISRFWDSNQRQMTVKEYLENTDECFYMEIYDDHEALVIYQWLHDEIGSDTPWDVSSGKVAEPHAGRYYFDNNGYAWIDFEEENNRILNIMRVFEG